MAFYCSVLCALSTSYFLLMFCLCYTLPFSQLYRALHDYDFLFKKVEAMTASRLQEAENYFEDLDPQSSTDLYKERLREGNIQFAIGVVSVKRRPKKTAEEKSPGYLIHAVAELDKALKSSSYLHSAVPFICNVDLNPHEHSDAIGLYSYLPYAERYGNNSLNSPLLTLPDSSITYSSWTKHTSKYNKETIDYCFCLMTAAFMKPKYILLLEDDTAPHTDFPIILEHLIESRLKNYPDFAYLKLYFPPKWQGFAVELPAIVDLVLWGLITTSTLYLCLALLYRCRPPVSHEIFSMDCTNHCLPLFNCKYRLCYSSKGFIALYFICVVSVWLIGRQNIEAIRRLWRYFYRLERAEGCCTQAQLYPAGIVDALTQYLVREGGSTHTDLAISDFASEKGLPTWQVEPNLFFHHGLHTSLSAGQKHPEEFIFYL